MTTMYMTLLVAVLALTFNTVLVYSDDDATDSCSYSFSQCLCPYAKDDRACFVGVFNCSIDCLSSYGNCAKDNKNADTVCSDQLKTCNDGCRDQYKDKCTANAGAKEDCADTFSQCSQGCSDSIKSCPKDCDDKTDDFQRSICMAGKVLKCTTTGFKCLGNIFQIFNPKCDQ